MARTAARATHCREQARLCRELADQLSSRRDAQRLRSTALRHDCEADALEGKRAENGSQNESDGDA
jgi:hypothetical protein